MYNFYSSNNLNDLILWYITKFLPLLGTLELVPILIEISISLVKRIEISKYLEYAVIKLLEVGRAPPLPPSFFFPLGWLCIEVWMSYSVTLLVCLYNIFFDCIRFEAGTPAIGEAIGLGAAIDYLSGIGMQKIHEYEVSWTFMPYFSLILRLANRKLKCLFNVYIDTFDECTMWMFILPIIIC